LKFLKNIQKIPKSISEIIANAATGLVWILIKVEKMISTFFRYVWYGILWPFMFIAMVISKLLIKQGDVDVEKLRKESQKIYEKEKRKEEKEKLKEARAKRKAAKAAKEEVKIDTSSYKNENVVIEKKKLGYYINAGLSFIGSIPKKIKKRFDNIGLVKQARNRRAFDTSTMLVDFSSEEDEENRGKRITWEYIAIDERGKKRKGYFEAYSRLDVQSFLLGEGLVVYSIRTSKLIQTLHGSLGGNKTKVKNKDLIFLLTQLSTY